MHWPSPALRAPLTFRSGPAGDLVHPSAGCWGPPYRARADLLIPPPGGQYGFRRSVGWSPRRLPLHRDRMGMAVSRCWSPRDTLPVCTHSTDLASLGTPRGPGLPDTRCQSTSQGGQRVGRRAGPQAEHGRNHGHTDKGVVWVTDTHPPRLYGPTGSDSLNLPDGGRQAEQDPGASLPGRPLPAGPHLHPERPCWEKRVGFQTRPLTQEGPAGKQKPRA